NVEWRSAMVRAPQIPVDRDCGELAVLHRGDRKVVAGRDAVAAGPYAGKGRPLLGVDDELPLFTLQQHIVRAGFEDELLSHRLEHDVRIERPELPGGN